MRVSAPLVVMPTIVFYHHNARSDSVSDIFLSASAALDVMIYKSCPPHCK